MSCNECAKHRDQRERAYQVLRRHVHDGSPAFVREALDILAGRSAVAPAHCAFEDCDREPDSTGFCEHHRERFPEPPFEVEP